MKTVGKGMREVKKASSELRRSTGIDELLRDDELRNPLKPEPKRYELRQNDRERENPAEGVDVAHANLRAEGASRVAHGQPLAATKHGVEARGSAREQNEDA
jgi:hypothetical protein